MWSSLGELIMVSDVFSMIWIVWSDLGYIYEVWNTNLESMFDELEL